MPKNKKQENGPAKVMTYQIKEDVLEALNNIIMREGHSTMHKAIDACILQRKTKQEEINELQILLLKTQTSKHSIEAELSKLAQFNSFLQKHTKTS